MSVYVDELFDCTAFAGYRTGIWRYKTACHMTADTSEELQTMALLLGLRREWLQHKGRATEHYDLNESKRVLAVRYGAVETTARIDALRIREILKKPS